MINKVDKNEMKMMMVKIMSMIMIKNDTCMSNVNSKCKSPVLSHEFFVRKEKIKKKKIHGGHLHVVTHAEKTIITTTGKKWNEIKWVRLVIWTTGRMMTIIAVTIWDMKAEYIFGEFRGEINQLFFMDDLKL